MSNLSVLPSLCKKILVYKYQSSKALPSPSHRRRFTSKRPRSAVCSRATATGHKTKNRGHATPVFPVLDWSRRWDLNPRPLDYESSALPLSYFGKLGPPEGERLGILASERPGGKLHLQFPKRGRVLTLFQLQNQKIFLVSAWYDSALDEP